MNDFLSNGEWFIWRDSSLAVWGERVPLQSWSGYRKLNDILFYRIDINGKYRANSYGLRPHSWSANLDYNGHKIRVPSTHPSCKSINDACRQADKALTQDVFEDACHKFLDRQLITCIAKADLTPFLTTFGRPRWIHRQRTNYPYGKYYYCYEHGDKVLWSRIDLSFSGYSGSSTDVRFAHWLE